MIKNITIPLTIAGIVAFPVTLFTRDFGLGATAGAAGLSSYGGNLTATIGTVVGAFLSLIGIVFFVLVLYGGILWMTAAGNQDTVKKSINTIISASIGLVIVLSAYAITNFVLQSVGTGGPSTPPRTSTDPGQSESCTALGGTCMSTATCTGGAPTSGQCPGPADWQCCVPSSPEPPASEGPTLLPSNSTCALDEQCQSNSCTEVENLLPGLTLKICD
jgi:hypothetical protein